MPRPSGRKRKVKSYSAVRTGEAFVALANVVQVFEVILRTSGNVIQECLAPT